MKLAHAGSIPVSGSKNIAGYNQTADGESHKLTDVGSIPTPATKNNPQEGRNSRVFGLTNDSPTFFPPFPSCPSRAIPIRP